MSLKPTRYVCTTPIGLKRKKDRMIAEELASRYPEIYAELLADVEVFCDFDQWNPVSRVQEVKVGEQSRRHRAFTEAKRLQLKEAINEKQAHPFFTGVKFKKVAP